MIGPAIPEKLRGQNVWKKKKNNNKETDQKQYVARPSVWRHNKNKQYNQ
jgi:hypothetical protein